MRRALVLLIPLLTASVVVSATVQEALRSIEPEQIRAHLEFLSGDLLEGRAPGTRGGNLAANYIAAQLVRSGVAPVRGSYFQNVPLIGWRADANRSSLSFTSGTRRTTLRYNDEAVLWLDSGTDSATVSAELVFIGYGVRAPEFQWDDYKGRDVRRRIVVVLSGDPPAPPSQPAIFDGGALTYYGRYTYKIEEAKRAGAAGIILVHTNEGAGYPWRVVQSSWSGEQVALPTDSAVSQPSMMHGWIAYDAARRVLNTAGLDIAALHVRAARRDFQPVFTGISAQLRAAGRARRFESRNVAGIVEGRHTTRRADVVVYTAHYDHLGIGSPVNGDSIYNGAYDNASGVALLLEIAEAFATLAPRTDRSILFLFTTAEEAGLLGASWYVRQPLIPIQRTVAALNIDGANLWGETDDIGAVGLERSTLGTVFQKHADDMGLRVDADRSPDKGFYFRSDQLAFARAGVPALYLDHGTSFRDRPAGWGPAVLGRYESEQYHTPADNFNPAFDLAGAAQQGRHAFLVGHDIANTASPPRWYRGGDLGPR